MNSAAQDDLDFCWTEVLKGDAWFGLHFSFAPKFLADRILALHALFAMLERPAGMSEETLALAQLAWWQAELAPAGAAASAHPVVRALRQSGALKDLPVSIREALVSQALDISRRSRPGSLDELKALCGRVGGVRILSELSLAGNARSRQEAEAQFAGSGLFRLLAHSLRTDAGMWFVPLDLQARVQVSAFSIEKRTPESRALLSALQDLGEQWFDDQFESIHRMIPANGHSTEQIQHLLASMASERLQLKRTIEGLKGGERSAGARWRLMDQVRVWRDCRRLAKQARRTKYD